MAPPLRLPPKPVKTRRSIRWPLLLVALVVLAGVGYRLLRPAGPASPVQDPLAAAEKSPALPGVPAVGQARTEAPLFPAEAAGLKFIPVLNLKAPQDGKPIVVRCLLRSPLDSHTEKTWRQAGLLEAEKAAPMPTPSLRTVRIANQEALDLLVDWHVEGVCVLQDPAQSAARGF